MRILVICVEGPTTVIFHHALGSRTLQVLPSLLTLHKVAQPLQPPEVL